MFRSRKKDGKAVHPVKTAREASPFDQLLVSLQRHCAGLSDGEATVTTGDGECHIRLRWRSDGKDRRRRRFRLDAPAGEGLWREEPLPEAGNPTGGEKTGMECPAVRRESGAEETDVKPLRQQLMLQVRQIADGVAAVSACCGRPVTSPSGAVAKAACGIPAAAALAAPKLPAARSARASRVRKAGTSGCRAMSNRIFLNRVSGQK